MVQVFFGSLLIELNGVLQVASEVDVLYQTRIQKERFQVFILHKQ